MGAAGAGQVIAKVEGVCKRLALTRDLCSLLGFSTSHIYIFIHYALIPVFLTSYFF